MPEIRLSEFRTDDLAPAAIEILKVDLEQAYSSLVVGDGNANARPLLEAARPQQLISSALASREDAQAMLAGLWLWHDWLDESHRISQSIETPTGSFWHAIMHRREGDFSNSKYWYNRCPGHPVMATLFRHASDILHPLPADKRLLRMASTAWNPSAFVDLVQEVQHRPQDPLHRTAVSLQQLEWRLLFDHCTRQAAGK